MEGQIVPELLASNTGHFYLFLIYASLSICGKKLANVSFQEVLGRGHRKKQTDRMVASLAADLEDEDGQPLPLLTQGKKRLRMPKISKSKASGNRFDPLHNEEASDVDDDDFRDSSEPEDSSSSSSDDQLSNTEVNLEILYYYLF
jgi:hypothetical protein